MFRSDPAPGFPGLPSLPLSLGDFGSRLWRTKGWALSTALAFGALAVVFCQVMPANYRASAQIYIDPQNLQLLERDLAPNAAGGDAGVVLIESQARVMASQSVLRAVAIQLDLDHDPEFVGSGSPLKAWLDHVLNGPPGADVDDLQRAVTALGKAVYVVRLDRTYVVDVHAESESATRAAEIANAVVQQYLNLRESQRAGQAGRASGEFEGRLAQLLKELETAENAVESFKSANNIVETGGQSLLEGEVSQANQGLLSANAAVASAQIQLDQLQALAGDPNRIMALPEAQGSPDMVRLRGELQVASSDAAVLSATLGAQHPRLLAAKERVAGARAALNAEIDRLLASAELNLDRAKDNAASLDGRVSGLTGDLQSTDSKRVRLRQLEREADASKAVYEDALLRSRETAEQAQIDTLNAQVVSQASPPVSRSFPPKLSLLLPVALLFGLLAGAGIGLGLQGMPAKGRDHA
ncbi:succinoglycan biosynthesis transport protein ExoP [Devosia sp. UYZn731]|uniref:GumC family protein n=1 Tax=Devosia sp. UYZn731 TaxID=3156345 RepID=UPI00339710F9